MVKKKPVVKKRVVKKLTKELGRPLWRDIDAFLNSTPPNVAFIREIPPNDNKELWYVFAKGHAFSINEAKPHIFQTYEKVIEKQVCSMCMVVIPRQKGDAVLGPLISPDSWIVRTNCPIFKARSFNHALQILEEF